MQQDREILSTGVYLNNSGAGLMSPTTLATVTDHLRLEAEIGAMVAAARVKPSIDEVYAEASTLVGAGAPTEIAYMDSASRAWNSALYGSGVRQGELILTLSTEFGTNLVSIFHYAELVGARVKVIQCDSHGEFDLGEIQAGLEGGAKLVAISHAAAHCGIVNPVAEIGRLCSSYQALLLVDACQSVGQLSVDVSAFDCDALTATGRKWLRGPRGTGFLYVRPSSQLSTPQVDLASADLLFEPDGRFAEKVVVRQDARQFELWERSLASMLGLGVAIREWNAVDQRVAGGEISSKANLLRAAIQQSSGLRNLGPAHSESGIVGFVARDRSREQAVADRLVKNGISYSEMHDWDCPLDFPPGVTKIFRMAPHYYSDWAKVRAVAEVIGEL